MYTWGRKQPMTWAFFERYCDEAYTVIDAVNTPKKRRALDGREIEGSLAGLGCGLDRGARSER